MPITAMLFLIALAVVAGCYWISSYKKHSLGLNAKERSIEIRILDKQAVTIEHSEQHEDPEQYWIYVEPLSGGPKREFQVGIHYYHAIQAQDCGLLTYKGLHFLHFSKFQPIR